jgi:hypothetical protein
VSTLPPQHRQHYERSQQGGGERTVLQIDAKREIGEKTNGRENWQNWKNTIFLTKFW